MRAIIFLVVVALIFACAWMIVTLYQRSRRQARWGLNERSTPQGYIVELVKPGQHPIPIGQPLKRDDEFEWNLELARSEAQQELIALNSGRKRLR